MANCAKIIIALCVLTMANSVHLQLIDGQQQQQLQLPAYQNNNMQLPLQGGFLSNMMSSNEGLGETLRRLPARGMQMLSNAISNVRNMIPGMGRPGLGFNTPNRLDSGFLNQNQQIPQPNMGLNLNNVLPQANVLPNLNQITTPVNDLLRQGQQLGQGLSNSLQNTLNGLTNGQQQVPSAQVQI